MFDLKQKSLSLVFLLQEVAPSVGETLCKLFPPDDNVDLSPIVRKARRAAHRSSHGRDRRMERPWHGPSRHGDFPRLGHYLFPRHSLCLECLSVLAFLISSSDKVPTGICAPASKYTQISWALCSSCNREKIANLSFESNKGIIRYMWLLSTVT